MKRFILFTTLFLFTASLYSGQPQRSAATPFGAEAKVVKLDQQPTLAKAGSGSDKVATIEDAADWLLTQQDPGGGFPWSVGDPTIYSNVQGPAGRGMLAGWNQTREAVHMTSATDCGDYLVPTYPRTYTDGDPRFATHDPLFLEELSLKKAVSTYSDFVQTNFWDKLTAGTYGEADTMNAFEFGQYVIDTRVGQGYALGPWDISSVAVAAHVAGETAIANDIMAAIQNGLDSTQAGDTYEVIGLAGAVWAASVCGFDLDPTVGAWASSNSTADLVAELLALQQGDGSWLWSTTVDGSDITDHDTQTTAFAVLALKAWDSTTYATEIANGIAFLLSLQQPDGQILIYPTAPTTSSGSVETHAEAMQAIGSNDDSLVPVELTSFAAQPTTSGVEITWATASETENLGYNIYRAMEENGSYTKINSSMIAGQGNSAETTSYSFFDADVVAGNTYYYKLADVNFSGVQTFHGPLAVTVSSVTGVAEEGTVPTEFALGQNYPNPFNPTTTIEFSLAEAGHARLCIYNAAGQLVAELVNGQYAVGKHAVKWNAVDGNGNRVASGLYLYRLETGGKVMQKKLVLMK